MLEPVPASLIRARDLIPATHGLDPFPEGWTVTAPHVRLLARESFAPGWYEIRFTVRALVATTQRARLELTLDSSDDDPRPPLRESFSWVGGCEQRFAVELTRPARHLRLDLSDCPAHVQIDHFQLKKLSAFQAMWQAAREKWKLLRAHRCFQGAVGRGLRLMLRGEWRTLSRKLQRGLSDARTMTPENDLGGTTATVFAARIPRSRPVPSSRPLILAGDLRGVGGYDQVVGSFLSEFLRKGIDVRFDSRSVVRDEALSTSLMGKPIRRLAGEAQLVIAPPFHVERFDPDPASAIFTMWETDRLQPDWVRTFNRARLVIVPSRWQAECFRDSGVQSELAIVPLGHDPRVFSRGEPWPHVCTFGTAGALTAGGVRKNIQGVIDIFRKAFPGSADVRLRIKLSPGSLGIETYDDPRIELLRGVLTPAELAEWYRSLTAYVNGSYGEGFGLHLLEAMACGRPIISAPYSGLTAFFDGSVGYPVEFTLQPVDGTDVYTGRWAHPVVASLITQLRRVHRQPGEATALGRNAAARAQRFTWDHAGDQLVETLRSAGLLPRPASMLIPTVAAS